MRVFIIALVLAAASQVVSAQDSFPKSKDGWWQMTMSGASPTTTFLGCTGAGFDAAGLALDAVMGKAMGCGPGKATRTADGWTVQGDCKVGALTVDTTAIVSGDIQTTFHIAGMTHVDPAPPKVPADQHFTYDGRWLGPQCQAGTKPGDIVTATDGG